MKIALHSFCLCAAFVAALAVPCSHAQSVYQAVATLGDPSAGLTAKTAAVAFDALGNVYVADTGNNRIQEFDANGNYLRKFGASGSGVGQFNKPAGVALDKSGNVYVADTGNNRIEKFTGNGAYLAQFGALGSGAGQFNAPGGVATDSAGNVYVADTGNNRVEAFSGSGVYVTQFGTAGAGSGQFSKPRGLVVDRSGNIFVADTGNNRIQKFNSVGVFQMGFGAGYNGVAGSVGSSDNGVGQFTSPSGVTVDGAASPNVYVADTGNNRVQKFTAVGNYVALIGTGTVGNGAGQYNAPLGVGVFSASATNFSLYVADTGNNRLQKFDKTGAYLASVANAGYANGHLDGPQGLAFDGGGNLFVANYNSNMVMEFNSAGAYAASFGSSGSGNGQFVHPFGVAIDSGNNIFVADSANNSPNLASIEKFNNSGGFITRFINPNAARAYRGIKINSAGKVYAPNLASSWVDVFDDNGNYLTHFGSYGAGAGQLNGPLDLAFDSGGNVYVSDQYNNNVVQYDRNGVFVSQFGSGGSGAGQFNVPIGIAIDGSDNIYVVDQSNARVEKFDKYGVFLTQIGTRGTASGQLSLPNFVAVDGAGNVYVTDYTNNDIVVFGLANTSITGTLNFEGISPAAPAQRVTFTFAPNDGSAPYTLVTRVPSTGVYQIGGLPSVAGVLKIKADKYLQVNVNVDLSAGSITGLNAYLPAGDANNDNSVDSSDFGLLIGNFGTVYNPYDPNAPASEVSADFNGDGSIDSTDFGLLIGEFNNIGDN